jgi:hypothetical protein
MREADHRTTAEELEQTIQQLKSIGGSPRVIIETAWGAGYHWIAYGCQRKHGKHLDKHQGLVKYLEGLNEAWVADIWRDFEVVRTGGWYGHQYSQANVQQAITLLANLHNWATM